VPDLKRMLEDAGLVDIDVAPKPESRAVIERWMPGSGAEDYVLSAVITARKPRVGEARVRAPPAVVKEGCCAPPAAVKEECCAPPAVVKEECCAPPAAAKEECCAPPAAVAPKK